jgi:hypothetical protein
VSSANDHRQTLWGKVAGTGLPATTDPRAVPPFVLVGEPSYDEAVGVGGWRCTFPVHVVAPPPSDDAALAWRLEAVEAVYGACGFAPAYPDVYGTTDLPAYLIRYTADIPNPAC